MFASGCSGFLVTRSLMDCSNLLPLTNVFYLASDPQTNQQVKYILKEVALFD